MKQLVPKQNSYTGSYRYSYPIILLCYGLGLTVELSGHTADSNSSLTYQLSTSIWISVLRIRDVYPGSRIRLFPSRIRTVSIPDPGSASKNLSILTPKKWFPSSRKSGCWLSTIPGSRIQGSKRHRIPDPDPQHWYFVILFLWKGWNGGIPPGGPRYSRYSTKFKTTVMGYGTLGLGAGGNSFMKKTWSRKSRGTVLSMHRLKRWDSTRRPTVSSPPAAGRPSPCGTWPPPPRPRTSSPGTDTGTASKAWPGSGARAACSPPRRGTRCCAFWTRGPARLR